MVTKVAATTTQQCQFITLCCQEGKKSKAVESLSVFVSYNVNIFMEGMMIPIITLASFCPVFWLDAA
jgi:hypothetical protein